eukprot:COSAG06_NODE_1248_length_10110_cov_19.070223_8_plen_58_part_00
MSAFQEEETGVQKLFLFLLVRTAVADRVREGHADTDKLRSQRGLCVNSLREACGGTA